MSVNKFIAWIKYEGRLIYLHFSLHTSDELELHHVACGLSVAEKCGIMSICSNHLVRSRIKISSDVEKLEILVSSM